MELAPPGGGTPSPAARAAELAALAAGDCHGLLDANGGVLFASPSVEKVTGYTPEEYAHLDHTELMHEADRPAAAHRWGELMAHPGTTQTWLVRSRHRDGKYRWLEGIFINLLDDPQWGGVVVAFTDVTEGRGLDPVVDTEGRLEALLRSSPDVIGSLSPDGTITWISNAVHQLLGFTPEEMVGRSAFDFIREEDQAQTIERMAAAIDDVEEVEPITLRVDHADGSSSMVEITGAPVHDPDGRVREFTISLHDVQWRHDALEALRASEQRFRSLTESSPTGIYQRDDAGHVHLRQPALVRDRRPIRLRGHGHGLARHRPSRRPVAVRTHRAPQPEPPEPQAARVPHAPPRRHRPLGLAADLHPLRRRRRAQRGHRCDRGHHRAQAVPARDAAPDRHLRGHRRPGRHRQPVR